METNLSQTIDIVSDSARYDASVKEVLADKQILARILKYSLAEFQDDEIESIINSMDNPVISRVRMEPGQTNLNKIKKKCCRIEKYIDCNAGRIIEKGFY